MAYQLNILLWVIAVLIVAPHAKLTIVLLCECTGEFLPSDKYVGNHGCRGMALMVDWHGLTP